MPNEWVLKPCDLSNFKSLMGRTLSEVGYTIVPRLSYGTRTEMKHGRGVHVKLCMLLPNVSQQAPRAGLENSFLPISWLALGYNKQTIKER